MDISVECGIVASLLKVCAANWCLYSEIHPLNTFYQIFCTFWIYPCVLDLFSFSLIRESSPIMTDITGFILPRTVCQCDVRNRNPEYQRERSLHIILKYQHDIICKFTKKQLQCSAGINLLQDALHHLTIFFFFSGVKITNCVFD